MYPPFRFPLLAVAALLLLPITSLFAQNIVVNGNFQTGVLSPWTQSGNTTNSGISANAQNPITANALNTLGYQAGPSSNGFLSQSLVTIPGVVYDVGFWFGIQNGGPQNNFFDGSIGGMSIYSTMNIMSGSATVTTTGPNGTPFTAVSALTTIQFTFRTNGDVHWFLDDVTVVPRTSAVPENSASLGLLAISCVALGLMRKRMLAA